MATYDQLPVYKATYDFLIAVYQMCQNMERDYKFSIGEDLKKEVRALLKNVYHANRLENKVNYILAARENVEDIRLSLRVLHDLKQMKLERFVDMNEKLESISKQLVAWHNYQNKKHLEGESRKGDFERNLFNESAD